MLTLIVVDCLDIIIVLSLTTFHSLIQSTNIYRASARCRGLGEASGVDAVPASDISQVSGCWDNAGWKRATGNTTAGLKKAFQRRHLSFFKDELQAGEEKGESLTGIPASGNSLAKARE